MSYPHRSHFQYDRTPSRRRVVITGVGAVSAAGVGVKPLWDALLAGRSCVGPITLYKVEGLPVRYGGQVPDFEPAKYIPAALRPKRMARHTQFAVIAAQEALADAKVDVKDLSGRRLAVVIGSSTGSAENTEEMVRIMDRRGPQGISPAASSAGNMQAAPTAVAEMMGVAGVTSTSITNTCSSGVDAVSIAVDMIRSGRRDLIVTGGADAPLSDVTSTIIAAAGMTSRRDEAASAGRPFDRERGGGVLGEGAGIVILEEMESALARGAKIYAEIVGTSSCPDHDRSRPTSGLETTMRGAMENAGREPGDIDFVSAWGCGDPLIDVCETNAIKAAMGDDAYRVAVGSIKGAIGIPLGAAGALQLVTTALSHRHHLLLPTVNWQRGDLDCDLDYVSEQPRRVRLRNSLLNAHAMTGGNVTLLLSSV